MFAHTMEIIGNVRFLPRHSELGAMVAPQYSGLRSSSSPVCPGEQNDNRRRQMRRIAIRRQAADAPGMNDGDPLRCKAFV